MTPLFHDGLSKFVLSLENKKRRGKGSKRPQKSSSESSSVTRKFVTAFSEFQTAFPAVSLFQKGDRQTEREAKRNKLGVAFDMFGDCLWLDGTCVG